MKKKIIEFRMWLAKIIIGDMSVMANIVFNGDRILVRKLTNISGCTFIGTTKVYQNNNLIDIDRLST